MAFGLLRRVTGVDLLEDLSVFFRALGGMIDGFVDARRPRRRAARRPRHDVPDRHVAAPRPGRGGDLLPPQAARGAGCRSAASSSTACTRAPELNGELPDELVEELGETLAGRVATSARELAALAARDAAQHRAPAPTLGDPPLLIVPERQDDVHDVEGLAHVRAHLWGVSPARRS